MYRHQQARPFTPPTREGDIYRQSYARRQRRQPPLSSNPIPSLIDLTEEDADVLIVGVSSSKPAPMLASSSQQQVNMPVWDSDDDCKDPTTYDVLGESVSLLASLKRSLSPAPLNAAIDCDEFGDDCDSSLPLSLPNWRKSSSSSEGTIDLASPRAETPRHAKHYDALNETIEIEDLEPLSSDAPFDLSLPIAESNIRDVVTEAFESWTAEESRVAALHLTPEARDAFFRALDQSIEKWHKRTKSEPLVPRDFSSIPSFTTTPSNPKLRRKRLLQ